MNCVRIPSDRTRPHQIWTRDLRNMLSTCAQSFLYFLALSPLHSVPMLNFPRKRYKFNSASVLKMRDCEFTYVSPFRVDPFKRAWLKLDRKRSAHYQAFRLQTAIHGATKGAEAVLGGV
jgi:hypothetical protein